MRRASRQHLDLAINGNLRCIIDEISFKLARPIDLSSNFFADAPLNAADR
jgi:hypothetical protein